MITRLLMHLLQGGPGGKSKASLAASDIGVICFYRAQAAAISRALEQAVDKVSGRDACNGWEPGGEIATEKAQQQTRHKVAVQVGVG
jgi:hypothetical protein